MYIRKHIDAAAVGEFADRFVCTSCGFESPVHIITYGEGMASTSVLSDDAAAALRAKRAAKADTAERAKFVVLVCRCPKCGARRRGPFVRVVLIALATPFVLVALWWIAFSREAEAAGTYAVVGACLSVFFGAVIGKSHWKQWSDAPHQVTFPREGGVP